MSAEDDHLLIPLWVTYTEGHRGQYTERLRAPFQDFHPGSHRRVLNRVVEAARSRGWSTGHTEAGRLYLYLFLYHLHLYTYTYIYIYLHLFGI